MRLLVCGSRTTPRELVFEVLSDFVKQSDERVTAILHGTARGADVAAGEYAQAEGIDVVEYPADWKGEGRAAGPLRNQRMLDEGCPDRALAFWDGQSPGTRDMIFRCRKRALPIEICRYAAPGDARIVPTYQFEEGP